MFANKPSDAYSKIYVIFQEKNEIEIMKHDLVAALKPSSWVVPLALVTKYGMYRLF